MSRYVNVSELSSINPLALETLLTSTGWRQIAARDNVFRIFQSPDANADVLIPLNSLYGDYRTRLNEALMRVEENLGARAEILLSQLVVGPMDGMSFQRDVATLRGSVEWQSGERLYQAARDVFRAAAKSSQEHLPYFGSNRQRRPARRYINGVRMGQTREGSYVITAFVPIRSEADMNPLPGIENYSAGFFRSVTANLMQASGVALEAAAEYKQTQQFDTFMESVNYGVSSELLDGLAKLAGDGQEVQIGAQWSPLVNEPADTPSEVVVTPGHVGALTTAAARLKALTDVTTVTVSGTVRGLERSRFGEAGISWIDVLGGTASGRRLRARLSSEQYEEAIQAHQNGLIIRMTGEELREGNRFWLYNVRRIEVVPAAEALYPPRIHPAALELPPGEQLDSPADDSDPQ